MIFGMRQKHRKNQNIDKPCVDCQPCRPISVRNPKVGDMRNTTFPVKRGEVCVWYPLLVVSTAAGIHYCWSWSGGVSHVKYFATYGWLKGLVTIFNPHLMDLSYLILKETTANNRTVRTQHILERAHNDDESQIINGHYSHQSGHCNVSLIWVLLTKTAHLFYDNHCENECSAPRQDT